MKFLLLFLATIGILFSNGVINCSIISSPGNYELRNDLIGTYSSANPSYCLLINSANVVLDCKNFKITNDGTTNSIAILVNSSTNTTVKNCLISKYDLGIYLNRSDNNQILNNTIFNLSNTGINLASSNNNFVSANTLYGSVEGIFVNGVSNVLSSNTIYDVVGGFLVSAATNNILDANLVHSSAIAYKLDSSPKNTLKNNVAFDSQIGYYIFSYSMNNLILNNTAYGTKTGIEFVGYSINNSLANNSFYNNSFYGLNILSANQTLTNNNIFNNAVGVSVQSADVKIYADHFYANSQDLLLDGSMIVFANQIIFDNHNGNFQNYSLVSINDSLNSESYWINWAPNPNSSAVPIGLYSFGQKFILINSSKNFSIDNLSMSWFVSELNSTNTNDESNFGIYYYLKNWSNITSVFDPSVHSLTIPSFNKSGILGIFESDRASPKINLISPFDGAVLNSNSTTFSFSAVDNFDNFFSCSLYLDGNINATNVSVQNSVISNFDISDIPEGTHQWFVSCIDRSGNLGQSETYNFSTSSLPALSIYFEPSCKENTITVLSDRAAISDASIFLLSITRPIKSTLLDTTDENGQFKFKGCGKTLFIETTKNGYQSAYLKLELVSCELCRCSPISPYWPRCY